MKKFTFTLVVFLLVAILAFSLTTVVYAEDKLPAGRSFPRLPQTPNDPELTNSHVYPFWGPICQRYTYSVVYRDKEGRAPEYMRIYFNGDWIDIEKENPKDNDYKKGVKYIYKFVPQKIGSNFYFFEASNGLGKARDGIIESPDNGPVLFESAFDNNEIALIDAVTGQKIWSYSTGKEWVGGVALSDDGQYLVVKTSHHVYLFETSSNEPKWSYQAQVVGSIGGDVKGGIDISSDGSLIFALLGNQALLFSKDSNQPLWQAQTGNGGYNAAISANGEYMAVATAGSEENKETNLLIVWHKDSPKRLWQYHSSGNFHDVSFSADGSLISAATGCPDRRGYLFSKDSNKPLWQSEMLTRDSPIHRAKISADGQLAVFGAESSDGAIHLYSKEANEILWKFSASSQNSFRALSITPNGRFVGGATTGRGQAFIFAQNSSNPLASWEINASLGAADLADDGSFLVVGGTDKKIHILERESEKERSIVSLNEFIGEIDVSGNGRFVAAGTGGSVYFFESLDIDGGGGRCEEIIEPEIESEMMGIDGDMKGSYCGDGICEGPETTNNCSQDCDSEYRDNQKQIKKGGQWPGMIFGFGFLASLFGLGGYVLTIKFKLLQKLSWINKKTIELKINRKIVVVLTIISGLFLVLTIISGLINNR